jgi:hypothetical protein
LKQEVLAVKRLNSSTLASFRHQVDATLSRGRDLRTDATRRKHFAIGGVRRTDLAVNPEQPDLTLDEIVLALHKRRISGSRRALFRFFLVTALLLKKSLCATKRNRDDVVRRRRRWIREQGLLDPARLVFIDETAATTKMVRPKGWSPHGERLIGDVRTADFVLDRRTD